MSDHESIYNQNYSRLNSAQRDAVDTVEGPVLVVAGPGTGKTQILTLRIANILRQTDVSPANILALTFTENATANMRRRLADLIGSPAYQVVISTFHSFCNDIIKNYPEEFPRIIGSTSITDIDQVKVIEQLLEKLPLKLLRPFGDPLLYIRDIASAIDNLKREGVNANEFTKIVTDADESFEKIPDLRHDKGQYKGRIKGHYEKLRRQIEKNLELAQVYVAYEAELAKRKWYDFSDMIMEVLRELSANSNLLAQLQEEHQYILIDEHQDTNNAQNKIIELIASFHDHPNLFVVGDEKQAIFRFQGASLENFHYFSQRYPSAKLITLVDNYRSTQAILDSAHALIAGRAELKANAPHAHEPIRIAACSTALIENFFLAENVKEKIASGTPADEIAILYRDNRDAFAIANVLQKMSIPFVIESDEDLLSDIDIRKLILLLQAIDDFNDSEALAKALHIDFLQIPPLAAYELIHAAAKERIPLIKLVEKRLPDLFSQLSRWSSAAKNTELLPFIEKLLKESRLFDLIITSHDARRRLEVITTLFDNMSRLVESHPEAQLTDFLDYIDTVTRHNILIKKKKRGAGGTKVRLMTVHKSKGLEFDYVYIAGAYDGHFGGRTRRDKLKLLPEVYKLLPDENTEMVDHETDDERRLFYVALTRAKRGVTISYATISDTGRDQVPTQFITELRPELIETIDTANLDDKLPELQTLLITPATEQGSDLRDPEYIGEIFRLQGLSVSALNNYLDCPWRYFYQNLIRLPAVPESYLSFGIAIHAALNELFAHAKERGLSREHLLTSFEQHLRQQPLSTRDMADRLAHGLQVLGGWYDAYHDQWNLNVLTEFNVKGVEFTPDIRLTGKLDKIEFLGDGNEVSVVDYKTGSPKSRNHIMGETKDAEGNYYRQLVFYRVLLDLYENGKYKMTSGEIDFIEPNDSGKYKKEKFEITSEEVAELRTTIERVATEILNLEFWDKKCDDPKCEYCALRQLMK